MMNNLIYSFNYFLKKVLGRDIVFDHYLAKRRVLDIGCGQGEFLEKDRENFVGLDANTETVEKLKNKGLKVFWGEATSLPFDNNSFDSVYCRNLIEHLFPAEAYLLLKESSRVLKPGGRLILISPLPGSIWNTFGHIKPYPPLAISKILRKTSLEKEESISNLKIEKVVYFGLWAPIKALFFLSSLWANLTPFCRSSYLLILRKED